MSILGGPWRTLFSLALIPALLSGLCACHKHVQANLAPALKADLCYVPGSKLPSQTLDLFLPGIASKEKVPVVVWIHGGAWIGGDKRPAPVPDLVKKGIAVAAINYRLSKEAIYPAQIHDCKAAVRFLRANAAKYNLDPARIGAWGMSSGGHLAALLGTTSGVEELEGKEGNNDQSSQVQAVCDWCGITDMFKVDKQLWKQRDSAFCLLLGGDLDSRKAQAKNASPVLFATKDDAPFLIMHGDKDENVLVSQSEELLDALKKNGVEASFVLVKNAPHSFFRPDTLAQVADYFAAQFKSKAHG